MLSKHEYDIRELPPDDRIRFSVKYRNALYVVSKAAIWAFYFYFLMRLLLVITAPEQTWQIWLMLLVEYIFARKPLTYQTPRAISGLQLTSGQVCLGMISSSR